MATLPTPGGDNNVWGTELNTWLLVAHNPDGTNKNGGSQPFGQAIYGDGSDGDVTLTSDTFTWPDPTGVPAWAAATVYAVDDRVVGADGRVWKCVRAGESQGFDPFTSYGVPPPGMGRRGNRINEGFPAPGPAWEQVTAVHQGWLEGPLFADSFNDGGFTLQAPGWVVFARDTATISGHLSADAVAPTSDQATGVTTYGNDWKAVASFCGRGSLGVAAGAPGIAGATWGGGYGGNGGSGADGDGRESGASAGDDPQSFTLTRRSPFTFFSPFWLYDAGNDDGTIGSSGGGGASDTGAGKTGGSSGSSGSGIAVIARHLVLIGTITALGGNGAAGQAGGNTGGGGGGSGGCIVLVYDDKTGAGTLDNSGGSGGAGQGTGTAGGDGTPGDIVELVNAVA